jgi:interferon gamma-inducible protein 30
MANAFDATFNASCRATMVSTWEVIPFGNAKIGADGTVTCQHGVNECKGNKLQACAQAHFPAEAMWMDLFRCQGEAYPNSVTDMQSCAEAAGMTWSTIETCYSSGEGDALIAANGNRTGALNPKKQGVPWVVVNDVPVDDRDQLLAAICDAYVGTKPACCAAAAAQAAAAAAAASVRTAAPPRS